MEILTKIRIFWFFGTLTWAHFTFILLLNAHFPKVWDFQWDFRQCRDSGYDIEKAYNLMQRNWYIKTDIEWLTNNFNIHFYTFKGNIEIKLYSDSE